jgi:hypothetical protein
MQAKFETSQKTILFRKESRPVIDVTTEIKYSIIWIRARGFDRPHSLCQVERLQVANVLSVFVRRNLFYMSNKNTTLYLKCYLLCTLTHK